MYSFNINEQQTAALTGKNNLFSFSSFSVSVRQDSGDWITQNLSAPSSHNILADSDIASGSLTLTNHTDGCVIYADFSTKPTTPRFGPQIFFDAKGAAKISLKTSSTGPMMSIYQHKNWWCRPAFINSTDNIPPRTQLLLWQHDTLWYALLVCTGDDYRGDIQGNKDGLEIVLSSNSNQLSQCATPFVAIAYGESPYQCCENATKMLLKAMGRGTWQLRKNKQYPALFEKLGWCSWDAFYHKVNHQGIVDKMKELHKKSTPVKWVLIDDGWSEADYEKQELCGLLAKNTSFPEGLHGTVHAVHDILSPEVAVGVWHASMGYWNGIQENSSAHVKLSSYLSRIPDGRLVPSIDQAQAFGFWNTWHRSLKQEGIQFAKVDGQSAISIFHHGNSTYGTPCTAFHTALEASAHTHFNGNLINCMGMASENVWNRPSSTITRSSDDFVPEQENSFAEHALQNAYNSIWLGQFDWCDWDMFWSNHPENRRNSILRAVSGGPVYTSDKVGETNNEWINPLVLQDGTLLRCDSIGMPTPDCLLQDPLKPPYVLKIFNQYQSSYLIACFNFSREQIANTMLSANGLPNASGDYIAYDYFHKSATVVNKDGINIALQPEESRIFLLVPIQTEITPIGLAEKYLCCGAITSQHNDGSNNCYHLQDAGTFLFYCIKKPQAVLVNKKQVPLIQMNGCWAVECDSSNTTVTIIP